MMDREVYENSATELYIKLCSISEQLGINTKDKFTRFPKGSNKLVGHIRSIESNLRTCGFDITRYYYTKRDNQYPVNTSIIKISKKDKQTTLIDRNSKVPLASLASLAEHEKPKNQAQNLKKVAKDRSKDTDTSKTVPLAQNGHSRHKKPNVEEAKDTFNILSDEKLKKNIKSKDNNSKKYTHFKCITCNAGEFGIDEKGTNKESILQFHKKLGHSIYHFNKEDDTS